CDFIVEIVAFGVFGTIITKVNTQNTKNVPESKTKDSFQKSILQIPKATKKSKRKEVIN
ncbi:22189_t:CDS:2, partial [Dentiscutata erythropus]